MSHDTGICLYMYLLSCAEQEGYSAQDWNSEDHFHLLQGETLPQVLHLQSQDRCE